MAFRRTIALLVWRAKMIHLKKKIKNSLLVSEA